MESATTRGGKDGHALSAFCAQVHGFQSLQLGDFGSPHRRSLLASTTRCLCAATAVWRCAATTTAASATRCGSGRSRRRGSSRLLPGEITWCCCAEMALRSHLGYICGLGLRQVDSGTSGARAGRERRPFPCGSLSVPSALAAPSRRRFGPRAPPERRLGGARAGPERRAIGA